MILEKLASCGCPTLPFKYCFFLLIHFIHPSSMVFNILFACVISPYLRLSRYKVFICLCKFAEGFLAGNISSCWCINESNDHARGEF